MLGNFAFFFWRNFFVNFFSPPPPPQKKSFRNTISVKQFGSRSGHAFCWARSGSKLFVEAIYTGPTKCFKLTKMLSVPLGGMR